MTPFALARDLAKYRHNTQWWMQRHRVRTWYLAPMTESELRALDGNR